MDRCNLDGCGCRPQGADHGPMPFAVNIPCAARKNQNFRTAFWTGCHLQMTLMEIPVSGQIGMEMHPDTDQMIRVEAGQALVSMGPCREAMCFHRRIGVGEAVFVPGGTWHNIWNAGCCPLKLSSVYAPPHHPRGTVHPTWCDAQRQSQE